MLSEAVVRSLLFRCTLAVGGGVERYAGMRETTNALSQLVRLAAALPGAARYPIALGSLHRLGAQLERLGASLDHVNWAGHACEPLARDLHADALRARRRSALDYGRALAAMVGGYAAARDALRSLLAEVPALRRAGNGTDCSTLCFFFLAGHCRRSAAHCCYAHGIERLR
jgi:hypothetical protein